MDPDANESSLLYKQLIDEKNTILKGNDKGELLPEGKERRKHETAVLQVKDLVQLHYWGAQFSVYSGHPSHGKASDKLFEHLPPVKLSIPQWQMELVGQNPGDT